jgi:hypothetical protein
MTDPVGGLRARLLHDNLTAVLETGLAGLGWFDSGRHHQPFQFLHGPHTWDVPVALNTIVVTTRGLDTEGIEVGSNLTMDTVELTADLYAENDSLGVHVSNDMRDLLRGRLPGGADRETIPILDFRQATPAPIGYATIAGVTVERTTDQVPEEWSRHVFTLVVTLQDTYY